MPAPIELSTDQHSVDQQPTYRGRFAPSPTGPLHFGSLVAALGSYLDAFSHGGKWLVRIEDLDPPREIPGASDHILATLESFGFEWTGSVLYQSTRHAAYEAALGRLQSHAATYRCHCTRKAIALAARAAPATRRDFIVPADAETRESIYPGTCRTLQQPAAGAYALRLKVAGQTVAFVDALQGPVAQSLQREVGDFVLRRSDGLFAYQLAVVVDDAEQGITDIVRGADLLDSTPRQIFLGQQLGLPVPRYLHLPVAVNPAGGKLSKQTRAMPIDAMHAPAAWLCNALRFLGHAPPHDAPSWPAREVLAWGAKHWRRENLPRTRAQPDPTQF
ncbi:MAG: tRNA glutamyl-Q(34) synthetase GluQRS [Betaproteobacteria bacterium]|nr:tRNA glutamyl-Q(34) synthetase GluQRS [Betaproteobacteria bacterium]